MSVSFFRGRGQASLATALFIAGWLLAGALAAEPAPGTHADPVDHAADLEPNAGRSLLLDVARAGARLVAVGERGHIMLSDDNGQSWSQSRGVPSRTMLTAVCFSDDRHGWAVGHDEIILSTVDAGNNWTRTHYAPESQQPLLDVLCVDATHAIAVGAYGSYFTTPDEGKSWVARKFEHQPLIKPPKPAKPVPAGEEEIPPDYHLNRIVSAGSLLFIGAESGQMYRSADAGATWVSLPSPYNGSFFGLLPLGGESLLAFGLRGNLFGSGDAGVSWQKIDSGTTAMLTDGARLADGRIALVGLSGAVVVSSDGGKTFKLFEQADRKGLSAVLAMDGGQILAVGEAGSRVVKIQ